MGAQLLLGALNSGELSPLLDGRVDKPFYGTGAKLLQNMIPTVQGPVIQRSGTGYVKEVKTSANRTALIPFEFNVEQAYALEFGDQYMRVHKDHAPVLKTGTTITGITNANPAVVTYAGADIFTNGMKVFIQSVVGMVEVNNREFEVANRNTGANTFELLGVNSTSYGTWSSGGTVAEIYEIATTYAQADLFETDGRLRLQYAQRGDVMYIVHPDYPPRKLTRTAHTSWTLTDATFVKGPFAPPNGDDSIRVTMSVTSSNYQPGGTCAIVSSVDLFESGHVGGLFFAEEIYFDQLDVKPWQAATVSGMTAGTSQASNDGNVYLLTNNSGTSTGSVAPTHTDGESWDGINGRHKWRYLHSRWVVIEITVFIDAQQVEGTQLTYMPNGLCSPAKTVTGCVNNGAGLFRVTVTGHGYQDGDYVKLQSIGGTTGANGSWKITGVAANTFDLVGSTFSGVYTAGGTARLYTTWKWAHGAFSDARGYPGVVSFHEDRLVLAQTASEPDSYWLSESASYDSFSTRSANQILATNSFRGTLGDGQVNNIEWALSMPDGLALGTATAEWVVEQQQNTDALGPNNFRARARSGHGSRNVKPARVDKTAFFVQRRGKKLRDLGYDPQSRELVGTDLSVRGEHLTARYDITHMAWVQEPDALLFCVRSDGGLISFTYQAEQQVFAWGRHVLGGYSDSGDTAAPVVESVISIPSPDALQNELWLIVKRYIDGATKRYIEYLRPRWIPSSDGFTPALEDAVMADSGLTYDGSAATTISGLWHLKGETVSILADGKIQPAQAVSSSGTITLGSSASVVQIGLPMAAKVQSMRLETLTQSGTAQGKIKTVGRVGVRLIDATNYDYGVNFSSMIRRQFTTPTTLLGSALTPFTGDDIVTWPDKWGYESRLCLQNDQPVPFGITAIFPEVEVVR